MSDQYDFSGVAGETLSFYMNFCDQWAGGVDAAETLADRRLPHRRRYAVGTEDQQRASRRLGGILDEDRSLLSEPLDHVAVVNDFVTDVDRCPEPPKGYLDDLDGPVYAGTESAWVGEQNTHPTEG